MGGDGLGGWSWVSYARRGAARPDLGQRAGKIKRKLAGASRGGEAPAAGRGSRIVWPRSGRRLVATMGTMPGAPGQPPLQPAPPRWAVAADGPQAVARQGAS